MGVFNPAQLTFSGEEVRAVNELLFQEVNSDKQLNAVHRIETGIVASQKIGFVGELGLIGVAGEGCDPTADTNTALVTEKTWNPKTVQARLIHCWTDWLPSFFVYGQKMGVNRSDLTNTDAMDFISMLLKNAMEDAMWRLTWFNATGHANVSDSPAGVITDTTALKYYTILDGLWEQLFNIVTADSNRRTTISENAGVSYVAQALAADKAQTVFRGLLEDAHPVLKRATNKVILCTQSMFENYATTLESKAVSESFIRIEGGFDTLKYRGVPIIPIHYWDTLIDTDFDNGTTHYLPHRAVLIQSDNIPVGLEDTGSWSEFDVHYDKVTKKIYTDVMFSMDTKVLENYKVQVAY